MNYLVYVTEESIIVEDPTDGYKVDTGSVGDPYGYTVEGLLENEGLCEDIISSSRTAIEENPVNFSDFLYLLRRQDRADMADMLEDAFHTHGTSIGVVTVMAKNAWISCLSKRDRLKRQLTPPVLSAITEAAKTCGWSVDYHELSEFVKWCHELAGKTAPNLEPYPSED